MGRSMVYALTLAMVIELALYLFAGSSYQNTSLFGIIQDPSTLAGNPWFIGAIAVLTSIAVAKIIPGNFFNFNQFAIYSSLAVIFLSFAITIVHLWQFVNGQLAMYGLTSGKWIASLITLPLLIFYFIAVFDWVRGSD